MANCLVTSSETLAKIALEVAEQLVLERLENIIPSKIYEKIDFNILEQEVFFNIQVTKCRLGCPDLKPLLSFVLKPYLKAHKVNSNTVVAIVQKKWEDDVQVQKVLYSKKRLSLIDDPNLVDVQKELSSSKDYTSIKILFRVENTSLSSFYDIMLAYIMQIESYDPNIKFLFRKDMMTLLGARKSTGVEAALGCKLIAKANNQFKVPIKNSKTEKQDSMDVDSQIESDTMDIV
ncbi:uncharacterized protein LOC100679685 isoform X2 [Nasonia vitripennis]|uniref:Uncharacterized protein n=1 Tax=Nasonia vitripennis TaxID=7425 RepID=A0A7M7HH21_NASVI|nr:uncharacterized protein LOC100679685 isoform X2 [Nasonia vitripennis]